VLDAQHLPEVAAPLAAAANQGDAQAIIRPCDVVARLRRLPACGICAEHGHAGSRSSGFKRFFDELATIFRWHSVPLWLALEMARQLKKDTQWVESNCLADARPI